MSLFTVPPAQPQLPEHFSGSPRRDRKLAVRNLQAAVGDTVRHIRRRPRFEKIIDLRIQVGTGVADLVDEFDGQALVILHAVISELAKRPKPDRRSW
jgi:hypothetical protein